MQGMMKLIGRTPWHLIQNLKRGRGLRRRPIAVRADAPNHTWIMVQENLASLDHRASIVGYSIPSVGIIVDQVAVRDWNSTGQVISVIDIMIISSLLLWLVLAMKNIHHFGEMR